MPEIMIETPDGRFGAYVAEPKSGTGPGIVLIQEIFGVNKVMRDIADGHAANGYMALCPDLFWRQQPGVQLTDQSEQEWQKARQFMQGMDVGKAVADLIATLNHLRKLDGCTGKVGSVGYCLGGRLAYLMATRSNADCNVGYYGGGTQDLLGEAKNIKRPLMLHLAEEDQSMPKEAQAKIKAALKDNPHVTIHSYAGAGHAFARIGGKNYNKSTADTANRRTAEFFKKHLA
jgi:carboxymethylenebutenolidase